MTWDANHDKNEVSENDKHFYKGFRDDSIIPHSAHPENLGPVGPPNWRATSLLSLHSVPVSTEKIKKVGVVDARGKKLWIIIDSLSGQSVGVIFFYQELSIP